jgi:hypothetical protein
MSIYLIETPTADLFKIEPMLGSINLFSSLKTAGEWEGILGDANGDKSNDWKPRGADPLDINDYTQAQFGAFINSWRGSGSASLFSTPYNPKQDYTPWTNTLTPEQLKQGFDLYQQTVPGPIDPYLAFRFAVDLTAGMSVEELTPLYQQKAAANLEQPI